MNRLAALALAIVAVMAPLAAGQASQPAGNTILQIETNIPPGHERPNPDATRTIWRYWETWGPEVFRLDSGEIVKADSIRPVEVAKDKAGTVINGPDGKPQINIRKVERPQGSDLPPEGWQKVDFDDRGWVRHEGPMAEGYRAVSLTCIRGKFSVTDAAKAGDMTLSVGYRGGVVAYLNGKEIGRANLPAGKVGPDTLADPYPQEAYLDSKGLLIDERTPGRADYARYVVTAAWAPQLKSLADATTLKNFQSRCRHAEFKVPAATLQKGVNVLALEVHRAPANEIMAAAIGRQKDLWGALSATWRTDCRFLGRQAQAFWWNHAMVEDVRLSAPAGAAGITPNIARPKGLQVWNESTFKRVLPMQYGDPNEPLGPVVIRSVPNGTGSGQFIVGSTEAISGLKVAVGELKGQSGSIPASAVQVCYSRLNSVLGWDGRCFYDALDTEPPAEVPALTKANWGNQAQPFGGVAGAIQPVWLIVSVPREAKSGTYKGDVTISAGGSSPIKTTLELRVVSDWACPDPGRFTTYVGMLESPDSLALQYNVPLWSDEHWQRVDRMMELLAQVGNREVFIPLITKTMLGNEQSMVRWVKQADGTYKHDFTVAEKYLDLAVRHKWNISVTCLGVSDGTLGAALWYSGKPRNPPSVTVVDADGKLGEMDAPAWGSDAAQAFWKPVIDGIQERLKKRKLDQTMMFGFVVQNQVLPETIRDLKVLSPQTKWWEYTHWSKKRKGNDKDFQDVGRMSWAYGAPMAIFWDPDVDKPHYAWRNLAKDVFFVASPRAKAQINANDYAELSVFRLFNESTMLSSHGGEGMIPEFRDFCGWGMVGADFWPVLAGVQGQEAKRLNVRYVGWGSLSLTDTQQSLFAPGKKMPAHTARTQLLRESHQETEARVFVTDALLDQAAKLPADLAARAKAICDERTKVLLYGTIYFGDNGQEFGRVFSQDAWDTQTEKLYKVAGEIAKALGKSQ